MITTIFTSFCVIIFSYLIGNLNFSILISKFFFKKEIRNLGSKNAGATNMLRIFGKKFAILTFLGDFFKGSFCVVLVNVLFKFKPEFLKLSLITFEDCFMNFKIEFQMLAMLGVVLGHIFPIFFNFKGGKGVSTTAGALLFIDFKIFIMVIAFFAFILIISKIVSLSSILTAIFYAAFSALYWFIKFELINFNFSIISFQIWFLITIKSTFLSFIIIAKHKENIKRLIKKTEPKIGR